MIDSFTKGQAELVTVVLLTGIMISLVSAAYFWGMPLIEKQKDRTKINRVEGFFRDLNSAIKEVAGGEGKKKLTVDVPGQLMFHDRRPPKRDSIAVNFSTQGSLMVPNQTIYLTGGEEENVSANKEAGVITAFSSPRDGEYEVSMRLHYRILEFSDKEKNLIDLNNLGRGTAGNREVTITVEDAEDRETGKIYVNRVNVRIG